MFLPSPLYQIRQPPVHWQVRPQRCQAARPCHAPADQSRRRYVVRRPQLSRVAENVEEHFGRKTNPATVMRWVHDFAHRAHDIVRDIKIRIGPEWVADEVVVRVGRRKYWLFNVMDSETRFVLAAYLSPVHTSCAAATAMSMARDRSETGLKSSRRTASRPMDEESRRLSLPSRQAHHHRRESEPLSTT